MNLMTAVTASHTFTSPSHHTYTPTHSRHPPNHSHSRITDGHRFPYLHSLLYTRAQTCDYATMTSSARRKAFLSHRRERLLGASTARSGCDPSCCRGVQHADKRPVALQSRPAACFLVAASWRNRRSCSGFGKPSRAESCREGTE